jgi:formate-dependent nitrite reductase cytochrome c552 subunit
LTIVNPSKLPAGIRTQICGSCHGRGGSTKVEGVDWPVGYLPGRALGPYQNMTPSNGGDIMDDYSNLTVDDHHMQYEDWQQSVHAKKGVSCTSCHYVHQLGLPPTQFQTVGAGSGQCLACHMGNNNKYSHSIHSFSNCIGCHMPRITKNAEIGGILRHNFMVMTPLASLRAGGVDKLPNACSSCHHHKDTPLEDLIGFMEAAKKTDMPLPFSVHRRPEPPKEEDQMKGDS